jgi:hypothetical protein
LEELNINTKNENYPREAENSLKDIILELIYYVREIWKKKWVIFFLSLPLLAYFTYKGYRDPLVYKAELTYTLTDGSSTSGLSGILGSMGLGSPGKLNYERVIALTKSRKNINKILFSKIALDTFDNKEDFVINHIIKLSELDENINKQLKSTSNLRFNTSEIEKFTRDEMIALKAVTEFLLKGNARYKPLLTSNLNEETGIINITSSVSDENLSMYIVTRAFENLKDYYINSKKNSPSRNVKFIEQKKDSIQNLLRSKQMQLARFNDSHRNLVDATLLAEKRMIETEIQKLVLMYGEVTKNYEIADFSLEISEPEIRIVDAPVIPLETEKKSIYIEIIKGLIAGLFLGTLIIFGYLYYKKNVASFI